MLFSSHQTSPLPTPRHTPVTETVTATPHIPPAAPGLDPALLAKLSQAFVNASQPPPSQASSSFPLYPSTDPSQLATQPLASSAAQPIDPASNELLRLVLDSLRQSGLGATQSQHLPSNGAYSQPQYYPNQWPSQGVSSAVSPPPSSQPAWSRPDASMNTSSYSPTQSYASQNASSSSISSSRKRKSGTLASHSPAAEQDDHYGSQNRHTKQRRAEEREEDQMEVTPSPIQLRNPTAHSAKRRQVFGRAEGKPLLFYVQPSLKRRQEVVDSIKVCRLCLLFADC